MSGVGPIKVIIQIMPPEKHPHSLETDHARQAALALVTGSRHLGKWISELRNAIPGRPPIEVVVSPPPRDPNKTLPKTEEELQRERQAFYASLSPARRSAAGLEHMPHRYAPYGNVSLPAPEPEPEEIEEEPHEDDELRQSQVAYERIFRPGRSLRTPRGAFKPKSKG